MTREEAIKILQRKTTIPKDGESFDDICEAFDMAIKALEQESTSKNDCNTCTHNNETDGSNCYECVKGMCNNYEPTTNNDLGVDCISRAEAIKGLGEQPYVWTDSDFEIQQLADWKIHKEMLENLPSVTPQEPKIGEWCKQNDDYFDWYECSECGYGSDGEMQYSSEYDVRTNYCPNCGARMIEPQKSEDKE